MGVEWGTTATRRTNSESLRKKEKNNVVSLGFVCGDGNDEFYSSFILYSFGWDFYM